MIFKIEHCGYNVIENAPFKIDRPDGSYRYIFFHFISQVIININGTENTYQPGTCILYTPKTRQMFYVNNNRLNHDFIDFISIDEDFFKKINFPLNTPFNPKESELINEMIQKIHDERESIELGNYYLSNAKITELFVTLSRKYHHRKKYNFEKLTDIQKNKFEELRLKIYQMPDSLKIADIAKSMGFSLSRFNELYKKFFNTTPINDLTLARITRVDELIKEGFSTKEIIKKIGFSSDEYFYRWFKKHFKMTKEEYIKTL